MQDFIEKLYSGELSPEKEVSREIESLTSDYDALRKEFIDQLDSDQLQLYVDLNAADAAIRRRASSRAYGLGLRHGLTL